MTTKTTILLVDDEPLAREELGGLLEDEGYSVTTASDGEQGLARFQSGQPDLVITDVRMPKRDGLELTEEIHRESPTTPIAVITGHGNEEMAIAALRAGATDFIKKPIRMEDVTAALMRLEAARTLVQRTETRPLPESAQLLGHSWTYVLDNTLGDVATFVDTMLSTCATGLGNNGLMELSLAARELILNAIEHGNLGLTYEQKADALDKGTLPDVLATRANALPFSQRRTTVMATRTDSEVVVAITDEGDGFDWRGVPDPTDPSRLWELNGRGILLARMAVDHMEFSDAGNRVSIRKRIASGDG